jgi:hypothetical protein
MNEVDKKISKITITYRVHLEKKYSISNTDDLTEFTLYIEVIFKRQKSYFKSRLREGIVLDKKDSRKYKKLTSQIKIKEFLEETLEHFLFVNEDAIECETKVINRSLEEFWLKSDDDFKMGEWYKHYNHNISRSIYKDICSNSINLLCANFYSALGVSENEMIFYRSFLHDYFEDFNVEKVEYFFYAFLPMLEVSGNAVAAKLIIKYKTPTELLKSFDVYLSEKFDLCYWDMIFYFNDKFIEEFDHFMDLTDYETNEEPNLEDKITNTELEKAMQTLLSRPRIIWGNTLIK